MATLIINHIHKPLTLLSLCLPARVCETFSLLVTGNFANTVAGFFFSLPCITYHLNLTCEYHDYLHVQYALQTVYEAS